MLSTEDKPEPSKKGHWVLWTLLAVFVAMSIGVMFAADYYYSGDAETLKYAPGAPE